MVNQRLAIGNWHLGLGDGERRTACPRFPARGGEAPVEIRTVRREIHVRLIKPNWWGRLKWWLKKRRLKRSGEWAECMEKMRQAREEATAEAFAKALRSGHRGSWLYHG